MGYRSFLKTPRMGTVGRGRCTYEATAQFAILGGGSLCGADSEARLGDLGAAGGLAVGVVDAATGSELGAVSGADALGTGVVGGQGKSGDGD